MQQKIIANYSGIILLLCGIIAGSIAGLFVPDAARYLKPLGDLFLNLLFTAVIPLIFFAIASAVADIGAEERLGRILMVMSLVFLTTIVIAAVTTIIACWFFPISGQVTLYDADPSAVSALGEEGNWGSRVVDFLTVSEFSQLLSREHMLAFIIFSFLVGIASMRSGAAANAFRDFLRSGNEVMKNLLLLLMKVAPVGLGAYFAFQVSVVGPELFGMYARPLGFYYGYGLFYFIVFFSLYAAVAGGRNGVATYWKNNIFPSLTAVSTCSSIATMPINLEAARRMGIPAAIANVVIPLGTTLHKNGSSISSIVKIVVAFSLIGRDFFEPATLISAVGITILVSIVAGGIPNGGYIGEMLMISVYGLPAEAIPAVMIIGTLVDPLATMLNATGDTVAAMLVNRFTKQENDST